MDHLRQVLVVPWNGYVNRLQALASASILAQQVGAPLQVAWEAQPEAPARAEDIFSTSFIKRHLVPPSFVTKILGQPHKTMPRYLTTNPTRKIAFLAGHDKGEQAFMPALKSLLESESDIETLVILAGGKFHLLDQADFISMRRKFYMGLGYNSEIHSRAGHVIERHRPYIGLHIRQTDRSREAPRPAAIQAALEQLVDKAGVGNVFIAGDTETARTEWAVRVSRMGLRVWTSDARNFNRHQSEAAKDAIVDWLALGGAEAIVYSATSSFGQEAALMNAQTDWSRGLQASVGLRFLRDARSATTSVKRWLHKSGSRRQ